MLADLNLDTIIWLQGHGGGLLDALARILDFVGRSAFYLLALTLVYWSIDRRLGLRLLLALVVSGVVVTTLKEWTNVPRPYITHPQDITPLFTVKSDSFPSGHVAQSIVVWGTLALYVGRRWMLIAVGALAILAAWARLYAGVHYPIDVIGSIVIGVPLLLTIEPLFIRFKRLTAATAMTTQVIAVLSAGMGILLVVRGNLDGAVLTGLIWGAGCGLAIESRCVGFSTDGTTQQRGVRYLVGIIIVGLIFGAARLFIRDLDVLWNIPAYALVGFAATAGYPWLAIRLGLMPEAEDSMRTHKIS